MHIPRGCDPKTLADRVRFVTAGDLFEIVNNLRGDRPGLEAKRLRKFLVGDSLRPLYDTAKVVEAIVHTRHIGANVPIFRLDWDVLFNDENLKRGLRLQNAILKAVDYYTDYNHDPHVYAFLFSASYTRPQDPIDRWQSGDWMGAFATRIFPSLLATDNLLHNPVSSTDANLATCFDAPTTQRFYGIGVATGGELESVDGITKIGSNPLTGVISGALLCMSDGAILDLPPFSSFHHNVMWIDDHLKYSLHLELKHLKPYEICGQPIRGRPTQAPDCQVKKERPNISDIAEYVLGNYLPTLVCGCIIDAWIQPGSRLKTSETGEFTKALQDALKHGHAPENEKLVELKKKLEEVALQRLEEVRKEWEALKGPGDKDTFASLWVGNPAAIKRKYTRSTSTRKDPGNDWAGWGLKKDGRITAIRQKKDLNPVIAKHIDELIEDALTYIEWALEWPRFVQSIRAVEPGALRTDLSWEEP